MVQKYRIYLLSIISDYTIFTWPAMASDTEARNQNFYRIIIIGGGIAGLSAANHLVKNGITDFILLEATDKLGGRMEQVITENNNKLEFGATWIHGVLGNPMYEIAMSHGLIDIMHIPKPHKVIAAKENGDQVPFVVLQEIYEAYMCFLRRCEEYFLCQYLPPDDINSVGEHIRLEIAMYLEKIKNQEERDLRHLIFECLLKRESCISGCDDMNEVDLLELGSFTELQGGNIQLPNGYSSILHPVCCLIPPRNIVCNSPVVSVHWNSDGVSTCDNLTSPGYDSGIDVLANGEACNDSDDSDKTMTGGTPTPQRRRSRSRNSIEKNLPTCEDVLCDGSALQCAPKSNPPEIIVSVTCEDGTKYSSSHVICTIPLGVLKESADSLFIPKLPQYKLDSIQNLSFGTVNKIFLEYSRSFLHPEVSEVMLLWNGSESPEDVEFSWYKKIYSFAKMSETVVLGWVSGKAADYMETLSPAEISEKCTLVLRKFLNDPYIPLPKNCYYTRWRSRKYIRGSYTSIGVGASQLDIEQIAQPLYAKVEDDKPTLLFAGEHTHSNFYSTVHGAFLSGRCAAQSLIKGDSVDEVELSCDDTNDLSSWIQGISLN